MGIAKQPFKKFKMISEYQKNKNKIRSIISRKQEYELQEVIDISERIRDLFGFFVVEIIMFGQYHIHAIKTMEKNNVEYYMSIDLSTHLSTYRTYKVYELLTIFEYIDERFEWLPKIS